MKQLEAVVATVSELKDGEMRQVSVGETDLLLVKLDGKFHAAGAYCSHYQGNTSITAGKGRADLLKKGK